MAAYWQQMKEHVELLAYMVRDCDPNGLDLYVTPFHKPLKSKSVPFLLEQIERRPPGGLPDMRNAFASIIEKYQDKFSTKTLFDRWFHGPAPKAPRKLSLYVLTDAVWYPKCDLKMTVTSLVRHLMEHKFTNKQIGIQFIRFGDHPEGIQRLEELDSQLRLEL